MSMLATLRRLVSVRNALVCVSLAIVLAAAPVQGATVTGVSGGIVQRGTLTISGSAFGSSPTVVLFDDFEGGTAGQPMMLGAGSAAMGQWAYKDSAGTPYYSDDSAVSGALSFRADMSINHPQYIAAMLLADTRDFFMSWWMYVPAGEKIPGEGTTDTTNWKTVWVQGANTADDDQCLPTIMATSMIIVGNDSPYVKYISLDFNKGQWKRVWTWIKGGYSNDGQVQYWELRSNGVSQLVNDNNVSTMYSGGIRERVHVNGYGRTTPDCHTGFDDVYIATGANARARVEIGNNVVYNDCTQLALCPTTSWSDTSTTAMANLGGLSGGPWYLFVVDADGAVSSGFELDTPTYTLTVNSGSGDGEHYPGEVVNVSADEPASGILFDQWAGDTAYVADVLAESTTVLMPEGDAEITATYMPAIYHTLTVNSGMGGGSYLADDVVNVAADVGASGMLFDHWTGDTAGLASATSASTTYTMPESDAEITAIYRAAASYNLTVNGGTGSGTYLEESVVEIAADAAPQDYVFDSWTGDVGFVTDPSSANTTVTVPQADVEVTAAYTREVLTMKFREGGGTGFVDVTFDDTWIQHDPADDTTHGDEGWDGLKAGTDHAYLIAVKDLLTLLPPTTGGCQIHISDASVHFFRYAGSSSRILTIYRMTTDWLPGAAGTNENNVSGMYAVRSSDTRWASGGSFSSSDYDTSVVTSGPWGDYAVPQPELVYTVAEQMADIYDTATNYGLCVQASYGIIGRASEYGTLDSRPYLEISYYYEQAGYVLTVNSGSGDGTYDAATVVNIDADAPASGDIFDAWTGDVTNVANVSLASTTITMNANAEITATYVPEAICTPPSGDLDDSGFVGQGDLDIVLDQWGNGGAVPPNDPITDSRADPSGDGFVGQADLDIVLDDWGKSCEED